MTASRLDVFFYGGPGSGKSTQAILVAKRLRTKPLLVGKQLRILAGQAGPEAKRIASQINAGKLVAHKTVYEVFTHWLDGLPAGKRLISDGASRDLTEVKHLDKLLHQRNRQSLLIYLKLPEAEAKKRILKRAKLENRVDDLDPNAVLSRIKLFNHRAADILNYYKSQNRLMVIDAKQSPAQITDQIINQLQNWPSINKT